MTKFTLPQSAKLTDRSTLDCTIAVLEQHFDLSVNGYLCQTRDLWQVLVAVAARQSSIETVCNDLTGAPDSNTVRGYINEQLTPQQIRALQRDCNRALASQLPVWLRDHPQEIACDLAHSQHLDCLALDLSQDQRASPQTRYPATFPAGSYDTLLIAICRSHLLHCFSGRLTRGQTCDLLTDVTHRPEGWTGNQA
jgi:hypothetical protein